MPSPPDTRQFDFGQNWVDFSQQALDSARAEASRTAFHALLTDLPLAGKGFVDIGFGQGLPLLLAAEAGARAVGCDINPKCEEALAITSRLFPHVPVAEIPIVVGSILASDTVQKLRQFSPAGDGQYDVVHSWGVLHHTGDMDTAIRHAAMLVRPGGHFILAIYNRHWSSRPWLAIKWLYVHAPRWLQRFLVAALSPVIYAAKWLVTRQSPRRQQRGMEFHHNVVDWVGGYPYEYASVGELRALVEPLGFQLIRSVDAEVPTGCNEFVFQKT